MTFSSGFVLADFLIAPGVFWPYFAGGDTAIVGLCFVSNSAVQRARGLDKLIPFGPVLFAIPMAVFGADHFTTAQFVASIVPSFIPFHLFWAYFVGVALVAAALSIATGIRARLAATMLGLMLFLFVVLMHIPNCFAAPHERTVYTLLLRDLTLSAGALAFGGCRAGIGSGGQAIGRKLLPVFRFFFAISVAIFGVNHFLHPAFAPGFPQDDTAVFIAIPSWIPAHALWAYLTGAIFIMCAVGILTRRWARPAAEVLGLTVILISGFVYVPQTIAKAADVASGLNYLAIHFALAGAALFLASALPARGTDDTGVR